ncbi:uncharacterized protein TM35_000312130 [Trypanosoma theileri]|uniref:Uncharacterized protein n=1 Tax=Trypanosoma theileri TaxID=67003 RepID=A0A1X0NMV2_9TRYP|nr:uncharacterized protein TM35_000312130 [Trypanosoma theileri]ORC86027.1 hypothetical protein TM35_000312130 [Trypanosoma theileri]
MTFVFEARLLPFEGNVFARSLYTSESRVNIDEAELADLPVWKRKLLPSLLEVVQQCYTTEEQSNTAWRVVLRILEEMPELQKAYEHIVEHRERQRSGNMTAEELMMEELLRERMGNDYLGDEKDASRRKRRNVSNSDSGNHNNNNNDDDTNSDNSDNDEDETVDIAMCFAEDGEVLGIGSAGLFGGHGYHSTKRK